MITRRGFLKGILAAGASPAIVSASSLMKPRALWVPPQELSLLQTHLLPMPTTEESFLHPARLLWPGVKYWWGKAYAKMPTEYSAVFETPRLHVKPIGFEEFYK